MNYTIDERGIHFTTDDMPIEDALATIRQVAARFRAGRGYLVLRTV